MIKLNEIINLKLMAIGKMYVRYTTCDDVDLMLEACTEELETFAQQIINLLKENEQ